MESQDKEKEYEHNVWEIYRKEWETASPEKKIELNKRMRCWQELMKSGLTAQQAYYKAMEGELNFRVAEEPSGKQLAIPSASRMRKAPLVFLGLALVAAIVYSVVITGDRNALNEELETVNNTLSSTRTQLLQTVGDLRDTKQTLASTQSELGSTKQTLTSTQVELGSTKEILASTQVELGSTKQTLASTQVELETVEAKLKLYKETTGIDDITSGVQPSYPKAGKSLFSQEDVHLTKGPVAINPTWRELKEFLLADPTDDETYSILNFHCANFAEMLHNNAEAESIRAAFVAVFFEGEKVGHALNAFKTTNKGLVFVDCGGRGLFQSQAREYDKIAYVMKGKEYGSISIDSDVSPKYSYYEQMGKSSGSGWESLGIVESIKIYW